MRRAERKIDDFDEMIEFLDSCDVLRLGISDEDAPYVVPVSFGYEVTEGNVLKIYIHGAKEGRKPTLLRQHPKVCIEADAFYRYDQVGRGLTCRYRSLIGTGKAEEVSGDNLIHALELLNRHCGFSNFDTAACPDMPGTTCFCITVDSLVGKKNLRHMKSSL